MVYTQSNNTAPASGYPKVYIDGTANNMTLDTGAAASLHDGNYGNGEQYLLDHNAGLWLPQLLF